MAGRPRLALLAAVGLAVVGGVLARDVRLDNNFAALFATSDDAARLREEHRATFGPDDGLLAVVLTAEDGGDGAGSGGAPDPALVETVDEVSAAVADMPGIARVNSPTVTELIDPATGRPTPAFGPDSALAGVDPAERVALARASGVGPQVLVSADGRTMLVVGELEAELDSYEEVVGPAERFRDEIDGLLADADGDGAGGDDGGSSVRAEYAGVAFTRVAAIEQMQSDLLALAPVATLLMAVLLALMFRRVLAVLAPLVAIGLSLVATAGVVGLAGDDLNQVTVIYPILLMGVVVASATHLIDRYYRERAAGHGPAEATRITVERVLPGAFVANATTAIGFASLVTGSMQILHEFGLYLAAGAMLAWAIGVTAIPAVLLLGRAEPPARYRRAMAAPGDGARTPTTRTTRTERVAWALSGRRAAPAVLVAAVAVVVGSAVVASTADYDYALADMLSSDDPTSVGNDAIDRDLAGIIPIEVSLRGPAGSFDDPDVVGRARQLDAYVADQLGTRPVGVTGLLDDLAAAGLPAATTHPGAALDAVAEARPGALDRLVTPDRGRARLGGFAPDHGGRWVVALRDRVEAEGGRLFAGTGVEVAVTGEAPVAYDGMNRLTAELVVSTLVALGFIIVAIGLAFRRVGPALVAALPNVVPVVAGMGLYALTSDTLDPLPGLVFCIAAGLAADDTIHLISRWREHRAAAPPGTESRHALVTALAACRDAMVASTLVLVAGFLSLALSGFGWNRELGLLGSVVLVLALAADLVVGTAGLAVYGRLLDRRDRRRERPEGQAAAVEPDPPTAVGSAASAGGRATVAG